MAHFPFRWSETWRVLAYTAALALAFIALGRLELGLLSTFGAGDALALTSSADEPALARAAADVEQRSRAALDRVPGQRLAAFRIGYDVGFASELIGSTANSAAPRQALARSIGAKHVGFARELGAPIGVDGIDVLPARNLQEFVSLNERFEADESGLAARIEARLSPAHRHLYLLGVQLGGEAAMVESSGGELRQPPVKFIRRNAILAGVEPRFWQPLALEPRGESAEQALTRYRVGLTALAGELAARDAGAAASSPAR